MPDNASAHAEEHFNPVQQLGPDMECLLEMLKAELDPIHSGDVGLHQLWLETQWLQSNLKSDLLCLPRNWQLIIFQMVRGESVLKQYPEAFRAARMLALALRNSVPIC